jgi:surface protein
MIRKSVSVWSMVILASLLLGAISLSHQAVGEQYEDFSFDIINEGTDVEITRYWGSDEHVAIPDSIEGKPVTTLDIYAFNECDFISTIDLPRNLSSIDIGAFLPLSGLMGIVVDERNAHFIIVDGILCDRYVTTVISCPAMREGGFILPDSVNRIESSAFESCQLLTSVDLGDDLRTIGARAFYGCTSLTSIDISDSSVNSMEPETFSHCTALTEVRLPPYLWEIPLRAFQGCSALSTIEVLDTVLYFSAEAFADCDALRSVTIPNNMATILWETFSGCDNLTSVSFAGTTIGYRSFADCPRLRTLNISDDLTSVEDYAFSNCPSLTTVVLPDSVGTIGIGAFQLCTSLSSIRLPQGLHALPGSCFTQCTSLYNVTIPDGVTSIGSYAFSNCDSLRSLTIPANVTEIGMFAFNKCESLHSLYFKGNAPSCDIGWVEGTDPQLTVYHYDTATGFDGTNWEGMRMSTVATDPPGSTGGNPFDTPMILAVLGLVAVIGVVAFVVVRKRRR